LPSELAHRRPVAPLTSGVEPVIALESIRWFVNLMRALTPGTFGAVSAA
jgi:hypothetical protein